MTTFMMTEMTREILKKTLSSKEALQRFDELIKKLESELREQDLKREFQGLTGASFRLTIASYILTDTAKDLAVVQNRTEILDSIQTLATDIFTLKQYIDRIKEDIKGELYESRNKTRR